MLPDTGARLAVEAGTSDSWWRYVAGKGSVISIDRFGHSAPAKDLFEHYGYTPDAVTEAARGLLA